MGAVLEKETILDEGAAEDSARYSPPEPLDVLILAPDDADNEIRTNLLQLERKHG